MTAVAPQGETPRLQHFLTGRADERLAELLAFALATEAGGGAADPFRARAAADLADHAARTMHNRIEEIRRDAVADQLRSLRRPLGFGRTVAANLVALAIGAAAAAWLHGQPALLAWLLGWFAA